MERNMGVNCVKTGSGRTLCTLHRGKGLYGQVRYRGYMRYSRLESKSGRRQPHRRDCTLYSVQGRAPRSILTLWYSPSARRSVHNGSPPPKLIKFTTRGHSVLYIYFLYCISICSFYIHILTLWYMCTLYTYILSLWYMCTLYILSLLYICPLYIYFLYCISAHCTYIYTFSMVYLPTLYLLSLWYICPLSLPPTPPPRIL